MAGGGLALLVLPPLTEATGWRAPYATGLGLAVGLPFAVIFESAQRLRPDAPGAAIALVNGCAILAIVVGTPVAGLAFGRPGGGAAAFVLIAALSVAALPALRRTRL
jgi:predicted MFS family arabinose efflux permease